MHSERSFKETEADKRRINTSKSRKQPRYPNNHLFLLFPADKELAIQPDQRVSHVAIITIKAVKY